MTAPTADLRIQAAGGWGERLVGKLGGWVPGPVLSGSAQRQSGRRGPCHSGSSHVGAQNRPQHRRHSTAGTAGAAQQTQHSKHSAACTAQQAQHIRHSTAGAHRVRSEEPRPSITDMASPHMEIVARAPASSKPPTSATL